MEKMPFNEATMAVTATMPMPTSVVSSDWKKGLPMLTSGDVTLRELQLSDAPSLLSMLTTEEVARFISPPPTTVEGFERFIVWANADGGRHALRHHRETGITSRLALGIRRQPHLAPGA